MTWRLNRESYTFEIYLKRKPKPHTWHNHVISKANWNMYLHLDYSGILNGEILYSIWRKKWVKLYGVRCIPLNLKTHTGIKIGTLLQIDIVYSRLNPNLKLTLLYVYCLYFWVLGSTRLLTNYRMSTKGLGVLWVWYYVDLILIF